MNIAVFISNDQCSLKLTHVLGVDSEIGLQWDLHVNPWRDINKTTIEQFQKAKRDDLIKNEKSEIEVIKNYLPQQKTQEETEIIINEIINSNNLESIKDMGKLMSIIKNDYAGEVDMGLVGKIAKSKLVN